MRHIKLFKEGKINSYFLIKLSSRLNVMPEQYHDALIKEAIDMSAKDISSDKELNLFINNKTINKTAYPLGSSENQIENPYNVKKWIDTIPKIYSSLNQGLTYKQAIDQITKNWDSEEAYDFKYWLKFYEENSHQKYKTANMKDKLKKQGQLTGNYYTPNTGVAIPLDHLKAKLPGKHLSPDMSAYDKNHSDDEIQVEQLKNQDVDKKIRSIIGRLAAAERLATNDPDVQKMLNKTLHNGFVKWLEDLQALKRTIQTTPLKAISAFNNFTSFSKTATDQFVADLIVREGLKLKKENKIQASKIMFALAQTAALPPLPDLSNVPSPTSSTTPSSTPAAPGASATTTPASTPPSSNGEAVDALTKELNAVDDEDINQINDFDINDIIDMVNDDDALAGISIVAQALPAPGLAAPAPAATPVAPTTPAAEPAAIEVSEDETSPTEKLKENIDQQDDLMEQALSKITIKDVVLRLENLANIFRNREISRQLAIVDLMMDKLGIAAYFPSLGEANSKSLESNQYALTRIEDILSKLRGSIEEEKELNLNGPQSELTEIPENINPNNLQQTLLEKTKEEKARKERNKELNQVPQELAQTTPEVVKTGPGPGPIPGPKV